MICSYDFSIVDFPAKYSMVLYFAGCNLRCPFCYNKDVVCATGGVPFKEVMLKYNEQCKIFGNNIGIVFTGGEPSIAKDFEDVYNVFVDNPKAIHTNGLVLPQFDCNLDSVILSLKSSNEGVGDLDKYAQTLTKAMQYYSECGYKELRVVRIEENMNDYKYVLDRLSLLNSYKLNFVEEVVV